MKNCQAYQELLKYSLFNEKSFFNIKGDSFNVQLKIIPSHASAVLARKTTKHNLEKICVYLV